MSCIRKRAPAASSEAVRKVMQHNVGRATKMEVRLQTALKACGAHFEVDRQLEDDVRCKGDIVFVKERLCVFVDGCFWHGCQLHFKVPRANALWWLEKIQANVDRDYRQTKMLSERGWKVIRFWEHELKSNLERYVEKLLSLVKAKALVGGP